MLVLGLDTATLAAGIAICDGDAILVELTHDTARRSADLLVAIDAACRRAQVTPHQLDAVAIGAGPGSFTGLRIGMATAKGIAFAAGKPLWAVSSLAAIAHDAILELAGQQLFAHVDGLVAGVLDARRGEVYAGCYRHGALVGEERVMAPADLVAWVDSLAAGAPTSYAGDALAAHPEVLAPLAATWISRTPSGSAVAHLALAGTRTDVLAGGTPSYIRASEAEIKYPDGVPGALRRR